MFQFSFKECSRSHSTFLSGCVASLLDSEIALAASWAAMASLIFSARTMYPSTRSEIAAFWEEGWRVCVCVCVCVYVCEVCM